MQERKFTESEARIFARTGKVAEILVLQQDGKHVFGTIVLDPLGKFIVVYWPFANLTGRTELWIQDFSVLKDAEDLWTLWGQQFGDGIYAALLPYIGFRQSSGDLLAQIAKRDNS